MSSSRTCPNVSRNAANGTGPVAGILNTSWLFASPASAVAHSHHVHLTEFGQSATQSIRSALERLDRLSLASTPSSALSTQSESRSDLLAKCLSSEPSDSAFYLESKQLFHMLANERRNNVIASSTTVEGASVTGTLVHEDPQHGGSDDKEEDAEPSTTILGQKKHQVDRLLRQAKWLSLSSSDILQVPSACQPQLSSISPSDLTPAMSDPSRPTASIPQDQPTLISISIHHPRYPQDRTHQVTFHSAQHTLADLRDHIFCPTDYMTEDDKRLNDPRAGHRKTTPSAFLIEDVLYVDGRAGYRTVDAVVPIIKYFQSKGKGQVTRCVMEETRLADVAIGWRINMPYVFVHQGGCEHMILVQDIQLTNPSTDHLARLPLMTFRATAHLPPCAFCHTRVSAFITYGDRCAMQSPCYWCTECYHDVHYNKQTGELVYSDYSVHEIVRELEGDPAGEVGAGP